MVSRSYSDIQLKLGLKQELPYTSDWSAAPDFLDVITDYCLEHRPKTILECSSGVTTLALSRCCQLNQSGRVTSLENGEEYAIRTRRQLDGFGLHGHAEVLDAPLEEWHLNGNAYNWYRLDDLSVQSIDMLVIDGPPGFIQKLSRYPAIPLLLDRLADDCTVFLDDAARDDEKQMVALWLAEFDGIQHQYLATERGCSVLKISKNT